MIVTGVMSGTSLDGLDLATCQFDGRQYALLHTQTISYSEDWKNKLANAHLLSAVEAFQLHAEYGRFIGHALTAFFEKTGVVPDAVASHGHTVFHQPAVGFSTQIGCGATIAAVTGRTTVCDFRSMDVALGGQGAPLVPMGDALLFPQYQACLNIGGIANISFEGNGKRVAFDVCVANMVLNALAGKRGKAYDDDGQMAASGTINTAILSALEALDFYKQTGAKSIGREWCETHFMPYFEADSPENLLATFTEHAALRIAAVLQNNQLHTLLVTGGGAYNSHLLNRLALHSKAKLTVPDSQTVEFKEALIFAYLGYLRLHEQVNTLSSVTGAARDSVGGAVYR